MKAQALFMPVLKSEAIKGEAMEGGKGPEAQTRSHANSVADGEDLNLRHGPCGYGWYVVDQRQFDEGGWVNGDGIRLSARTRSTPIDDLVMWRPPASAVMPSTSSTSATTAAERLADNHASADEMQHGSGGEGEEGEGQTLGKLRDRGWSELQEPVIEISNEMSEVDSLLKSQNRSALDISTDLFITM